MTAGPDKALIFLIAEQYSEINEKTLFSFKTNYYFPAIKFIHCTGETI